MYGVVTSRKNSRLILQNSRLFCEKVSTDFSARSKPSIPFSLFPILLGRLCNILGQQKIDNSPLPFTPFRNQSPKALPNPPKVTTFVKLSRIEKL